MIATRSASITYVEAIGSDCIGILIRSSEDGSNGYRFWIRTDEWKCQFAK
ncbi:hypothetical protein ACFL6S_21145 [Candidatus Poribacteria bacterium]